MKKIKSLLSLVLCFALLFAVAGCNSTDNVSSEEEWEVIVNENATVSGGETVDTNSTGTASGSGNSAASNATATGAKNKDFLSSLKGLEINIFTQQTEKPTRGTTSGDRYFAILNKVAKQYGVTINYLDTTPGNLQQSILSGKPAANVIGIQDYRFISWMNAGTAADLTNAMKETGITFKEKWYNPDGTKIGNLNNKQYAFNSDIYAPFMLIYNKRMIQENGLTDPIKLYTEGNWTFDTLGEYLRKLQKTSADGNVIVRGLSVINSNSIASHLVSMNGGSFVSLQNGKMTNTVNTTAAKTALQYLNTWVSVDKTVGGQANWKDAFNNFANGKAAMVLGTKYAFSNMAENNMTDAVGVVPFPYGPNASAKTSYTYTQIFLNIIPKSEEAKAGKILFVMNEVYKELYAVREEDFKDDFRALIRDNDSYNLFKDYSLGNKKLDFSYYNLSGIVYDQYTALSNISGDVAGGMAVETAINTYSTSITSSLNEAWGKYKITG